MRKYQIIYADPPWKRANTSLSKKNAIKKSGSRHYNSMTLKELCSLPVHKIAKEDCLLFMWAVSPALDWAIELGRAWGFEYITVAFVWDKQRVIPGNYTASQVELCLLFKKGKIPKPRGSTKEHQFLSEMRRAHSQKPDTIRDRISRMFPKQRKIELFARQKFVGWDYFGNEIEGGIEL